jgi:sRNA-binding protein
MISQAGRHSVSASDDDWDKEDKFLDDEWPDDDGPDEPWPDEARPAGSWPGHARPAGPGPGSSGGQPRRRRAQVAATIAMVFAAAGIGGAAVIVARDLTASQTATPTSAPSSQPTGQAGGNGLPGGSGSLPGGGSLPGPGAQVFIGGPVTAVTSTSITLGGPDGQTVTAAVTAATRVTGKVSSISGIKVGDQVSVQLTQNGNTVTVVAIQDPAQQPNPGNSP